VCRTHLKAAPRRDLDPREVRISGRPAPTLMGRSALPAIFARADPDARQRAPWGF
jgi:hypothetical protein